MFFLLMESQAACERQHASSGRRRGRAAGAGQCDNESASSVRYWRSACFCRALLSSRFIAWRKPSPPAALDRPADVLAGRARAGQLAIEAVVVIQVLQQPVAGLRQGGGRALGAMGQVMGDVARQPRTALGGPLPP